MNGMGSGILVRIDKLGRLVLPKPLRDRFRLGPGSVLEVGIEEDGLSLRPVDREPALVKVDGWWVHQGLPDSDDALAGAVRRHRDERLDELSR